MVCCEGRVKIFDSVTGELVSVLQPGMNLSGQLQAITLGPAGMAVGVTVAGEVVCIPVDGQAWSVMAKLDRGLKSLCATGNQLFALSSDRSKVYQIVLEEKPGHPLRAKSFPVVKGAKGITAMASNGSTGFAWSSGKRVWLWSVQSDVNRKTIESVEFDHLVTTLAWSTPTDLAVGFSTGGMQVVHGLNLAETGHFTACLARQSKRLHWHSSAVLAMASATDGYLVTGGTEAVAVLWNASRGSTQFLPRLGAPILHVSPNVEGNKWALGLEDNSIHIVSSATFSVTCEVRGLVPGSDHGSILSLCPLDKGAVMVSGSTGSLQFYNPVADKHVGSLRITQENLISALPEHKDRPIQHRQVKHVAKLGSSLLATYECVGDAGCLRIWKFSAKIVYFEQVAVWDDPHGAKTAVTALTFSPSGQLITADAKGYIRVWSEVSAGSNVYHCSYITNEPFSSAIASLEVSSDGSLLAVSCGRNVLLLETSGYTLVRSLGTGCHTGTICDAHFFSTDSSDHLVVYDNVSLTSWNLRSLQIEWSLNVAITAFARNEIGSGFAIVTASSSNPDDSYVLQFEASSPIPQLARRHTSKLRGLVFVAHQSTVLLLALTSRGTFTQAFPEDQPTDDLHLNSASPMDTPLAKSILEAADRASQNLIPVKKIEVLLPQTSTAKHGELLLTEVPSHVLPSMRLLCASFMNLRLPKAKKN